MMNNPGQQFMPGNPNYPNNPNQMYQQSHDKQTFAQKIIKNAPVALSEAIQAINASVDKTKNGYEQEIHAFGRLFSTTDFKEGTTAFLEKRKANFSGK